MTELSLSLPYRWIGGNVALDFANTVAWSMGYGGGDDSPLLQYERLTSYERLVDWGREAGLVDTAAATSLLDEAGRSPREARMALERAKTVRGAIHRLFTHRARHERSPPDALAVLNAVYREAGGRRVIVETQEGSSLTWLGAASILDAPLWPVSSAAAELLTSAAVENVRPCAGIQCGFLFLDTSRGGRRRWCDMAHCGNISKERRHRHRKRQSGAAGV